MNWRHMSILSEYKHQFSQISDLYVKLSHYAASLELIDCIVILYCKVRAFHGYIRRAHMNEHA